MTPPKPTVLIVDDDECMRDALARLLEVYGYYPLSVQGGAEALAYLESHPHPALILLDLLMPEMSGIEFMRRMRLDPALADIPVVVLTGRSLDSLPSQVRAAAYLEKPVDPKNLLLTMRRLIA